MANQEPTREPKPTLTDEQKKQIKQESGKDAGEVSFNVEELEPRVAPRSVAL